MPPPRLEPPYPSPAAVRQVIASLRRRPTREAERGIDDGANATTQLILRRAITPGQLGLAFLYPILTVGMVAIASPLSPHPLIYCFAWWNVVVLASIWPILDHFFDELRRLKTSGTLRDAVLAGVSGRELGDALTAVAFFSLALPMLIMLMVAPFVTRYVGQHIVGVGDPLPAQFFRLQFLAIPLSLASMLLSGTVAWWQVLRSNEPDARSWFGALVAACSLAATCIIMPLPFSMLLAYPFAQSTDWATQVISGVSVNVLPGACAMLVAAMILARMTNQTWPIASTSGQFDEG